MNDAMSPANLTAWDRERPATDGLVRNADGTFRAKRAMVRLSARRAKRVSRMLIEMSELRDGLLGAKVSHEGETYRIVATQKRRDRETGRLISYVVCDR